MLFDDGRIEFPFLQDLPDIDDVVRKKLIEMIEKNKVTSPRPSKFLEETEQTVTFRDILDIEKQINRGRTHEDEFYGEYICAPIIGESERWHLFYHECNRMHKSPPKKERKRESGIVVVG
ncbi:MAG: hypothetical protein PVF58_14220 [Candidatus Methanofastidiosia archaeon]|jgi:hypothetical protein